MVKIPATTVKYSQDDIIKILKSGSKKDHLAVSKLFAEHGFDIDDFFDDYGIFDADTTMFKEALAKVTGGTAVTKTDDVFDAAKWYDSIRKNDLSMMDKWTQDWLKTISPKERDGIVTYTSNAFENMNRYLRGMSRETRYAKEIEAARSALSKASLPQETIVRRGSGYNMLESLGMGAVTKDNVGNFIGAVVEDKGFVSTSPSPRGGFPGTIEYVIKLPKGSQAMYVDSISAFQGEQEILINCGGKFVVEDVEIDDWGYVTKIYMTLINLQ
jgi:hypothetical protein